MSKILNYAQALEAIRTGQVLVYPTGTFYALGCHALMPQAVDRVFRLKQRDPDKAVPLVIGRMEQVAQAVQVPDELKDVFTLLAARFWPGPLTMVMPAAPGLPRGVTGQVHGQGPLAALRLSAHPLAARLAGEAGAPLVATSANLSGRPPTADPGQVEPDLVERTTGILDARPWPGGGEPSTLVMPLMDGRAEMAVRILRPGTIRAKALIAAGVAVLD